MTEQYSVFLAVDRDRNGILACQCRNLCIVCADIFRWSDGDTKTTRGNIVGLTKEGKLLLLSQATGEEALQKHQEWQGKLEVTSKAKVDSREALAIAYTPGVAEPCKEIRCGCGAAEAENQPA